MKFSVKSLLDAKIETVLNRSKNLRERPLLDKNNLKDAFRDIYEKRKKVYSRANFKINCNRINRSKVAEKIIKIYESK